MAGSGVGIGNIISGVIGAAAVVIVAYLRGYLDKRTRRRKLRRAIYAELEATNTLGSALEMLNSSSGQYFYTQHDFIPTDVYQSNLADIGLLSEDEIEHVVEYYSNALVAKEERAGCAEVMDNGDLTYEQKSSAVGSFKNRLEYLQDVHQNAIESIESQMNDAPADEVDKSNTAEETEGPSHQSDETISRQIKIVTDEIIQPWRVVWQRVSALESILAFFVIPFVLIAVEASVESEKWALPLSVESILQPTTIPLAFTSSYVHAGPSFLWGNVQGYLLIMSALFPLAVLAERKRELLAISTFNLLIVPFIASWTSLILPLDIIALGFSGVNAAFLGTLLVFLFEAWSVVGENINPGWSLSLGLLSLAVAFAFAPVVSPILPFLPQYIAIFGILGLVLTVTFFRRNGIDSLQVFSPHQNSVLFWGLLISTIGFAGLFILVPPYTNVLAHLSGFYAGFSLPFALVFGRETIRPIREKSETLRKYF